MCGLSGIIAFSAAGYPNLERISESLQSVSHRGPDFQAIHRGENFAVAHARLSILDLSPAAHQPFFDENRLNFILHNGEIFNFPKLRQELQAEGTTFNSDSDTEVILKHFAVNGASCFSRLDGFFATVIYDADRQCWYLGRDPYGVKPLYYYSDENIFAFSSELQGLTALGITRQPDWDSLFAYFQLSYIPQPWTALQNVRQVRPGYYIKVDTLHKTVEEVRYCTYPEKDVSEGIAISKGKEVDMFNELFYQAVEKRLISDVPLGAFLSGGLDSTAVVAAASGMTRGLKTYSIGFSDDPYYDESRYAEEVARLFRTDHHTIHMSTGDMLEVIPEVLDHFGEPFGDSSAIAVYLLSREVGKEIRVALSGDGGDEVLGGYNKHLAESMLIRNSALFQSVSVFHPILSSAPQGRHNYLSNKTRQLERFLQGAALSPADRYWQWCCFKPEEEVRKMITISHKLGEFEERRARILRNISLYPNDLNKVLSTDLQLVLPGDMLVKTDRMSMAHALEIRSPFLDHALIQYCSALPASWKVKGRTGKVLLRKSLEHKIPDHILNRPKQGFEVPLQRWLNGALKESLLKPLLNNEYLINQAIFDPEEIKILLKKLACTNPGDSPMQVWAILVFQHWWKKYIE